jgi:hypothetical protein
VTILWNDLEILRIVDECDRGERFGIFNGWDLMQATAASRGTWAAQDPDFASFLRELFVLHSGGLLTWKLMAQPAHVRQIQPHETQAYLQQMRDFALTYDGRNQARGRVIQVPLPDPAEDNGLPIASLTLEDVAQCIDRKYAPHQAVQLLIESGISLDDDRADGGETWEQLFVIFMTLEQGVSGQRRELRHFVGAWLDDRLRIGPSDEERDRIASDLARQGWFVEEGRLVIGEPVRKRRLAAPRPSRSPSSTRSWEAAQPQWKAKHPHYAVLDAAKAVNAMLQAKVERNDVSEVKRVQPSFSTNPPTATEPRLRFPDIADQQTRDSVTAGVLQFGVGCFMATRNPIGHRPDDEHEMTEQEALEQLAAWSLFARWIERATVTSAD